MDDLYFAIDTGDRSPHCLILTKTPDGLYHLGFATRDIAESYISRKGAGGYMEPIAKADLTPDHAFDQSVGLLVIDSVAALDGLLADAQSFNYHDRTRPFPSDVTPGRPLPPLS